MFFCEDFKRVQAVVTCCDRFQPADEGRICECSQLVLRLISQGAGSGVMDYWIRTNITCTNWCFP